MRLAVASGQRHIQWVAPAAVEPMTSPSPKSQSFYASILLSKILATSTQRENGDVLLNEYDSKNPQSKFMGPRNILIPTTGIFRHKLYLGKPLNLKPFKLKFRLCLRYLCQYRKRAPQCRTSVHMAKDFQTVIPILAAFLNWNDRSLFQYEKHTDQYRMLIGLEPNGNPGMSMARIEL